MTPTDGVNLAILVVSLLTALLGLIPLLSAAARLVRGRHSAQDLELLRRAAMDAVRAVEQTMKKRDPKASSDEKLLAALEVAARSLAIYGVKVDQAQLRMAIENAVFLMNAGLELPPPPNNEPEPVPVVGG